MFRNETPMASPVFGDFPWATEIRARRRRKHEIAGPGCLEELQQLTGGVGQVGIPRACQKIAVIQFDISAESERIATFGLIGNQARRLG